LASLPAGSGHAALGSMSAGAGDMVILLHGLGRAAGALNPVFATVRRDRRIIARGTAGSSKMRPGGDLSPPDRPPRPLETNRPRREPFLGVRRGRGWCGRANAPDWYRQVGSRPFNETAPGSCLPGAVDAFGRGSAGDTVARRPLRNRPR
jgi:hypothetical protein